MLSGGWQRRGPHAEERSACWELGKKCPLDWGGGAGWEGTYCKQDEVLLVVLAHTVIDPGTVVVHLPNAPLTHTETATGEH